ncbi:inactive hydroxysteroid dehydrogenase-like protein 1 isoform X1 [Tachyglossus aculeatus]|uniref:inactive hydroxysteroid dehydrogenase-like protein 1 isoform X1 n=2 Tax=Tachyglossus aculeatus TaxID=9261 RepID=UPI0018F31673|nr:inactive hydroxysteroid dehydrogenase-like protein 1 isoform X1 [Tachyglossus aculeatus]XP_038627968.1 inactive hydroxysteroid dehydrogenase-like protein 1 isoform X1 [Tachyglossus aculeatus]XP_038627969.1 inactive hydroxysteroid dehydrogenase-like protein 1 isoform X1 [Tachyglossus aculeatus]
MVALFDIHHNGLLLAMAAVDSFYFLYREIARSCNCYLEALALVGAWYTARKSITIVHDFYSLIRLHFIPRLVSRADLIKQYGRWAVVSGATDGIGKAYAEELASHGLNIILISRNKEKLEKVAKNIAEVYKVETDIIVADFSNGREIYSPIREALRDKDIGILVNNVGVFYPYPQYFTQLPEEKLWDIINVNIAAANFMIHIVLPGMVDRKKGAIVNISSGSCCKPTPQMTAYSASKAYLDHFSRALQYEYASKGIFVQSLIPFYVATNMTAYSGFLHSNPWLVPSPKVYAQHAVSTLGISKRTTGYWFHSIQFIFAQYMPEWLWVWGANILNSSLRHEALSHRL